MIIKKYINEDEYYDLVIFSFSHRGREKNRVNTMTFHYQRAPLLFMGIANWRDTLPSRGRISENHG